MKPSPVLKMSAQSPPMSVAVAEQLTGDRVTVGLVMDQDTPERVAGLRAERR
jgi:hypothetical protein